MNKYLPQATGFIYLLLFVFCISTIPVTVKIGLRQQASAFEIITVRMVIATVVLWAGFLCFKPDVIRVDRTGVIGCMQVAIINFASLSFGASLETWKPPC